VSLLPFWPLNCMPLFSRPFAEQNMAPAFSMTGRPLDSGLQGFGIGGGIAHLREATSGSMPESRRLVQRSSLAQESEGIALARSAGNATPEARCSRFKGDASADRLLHTPIKTQPAPGGSSDHGVFCGSGCASPAITPTPFPTTSEKVRTIGCPL